MTSVPWAAALGWMIGVAPVLVVVISFLVIEDRQGQSVVARLWKHFKADGTSEGYPTLDANDDEVVPEAAGGRAKSELLQRNTQRSEPGAAIYETQQLPPASPEASSSSAAASRLPPQMPPPTPPHTTDVSSSAASPDVAAAPPSSNAPTGRADEGGT